MPIKISISGESDATQSCLKIENEFDFSAEDEGIVCGGLSIVVFSMNSRQWEKKKTTDLSRV